MTYEGLTWFNLSSPYISKHKRGLWVRPWNAFNRVTADGDHFWGFGILQVGKRHLFCIGTSGVSILFIGKTA